MTRFATIALFGTAIIFAASVPALAGQGHGHGTSGHNGVAIHDPGTGLTDPNLGAGRPDDPGNEASIHAPGTGLTDPNAGGWGPSPENGWVRHYAPMDVDLSEDVFVNRQRKTKVWVATGLDIKRAIDPGDRDYIHVVPGPLVQALFDALDDLGFELMEADCEEVERRSSDELPFLQEFEYKAFSGPFRGRLSELELVCFVDEDEVEAYIDLDLRQKGAGSLIELLLKGEVGERTRRSKLTYGPEDLDGLKDRLYEIIDHALA